MNKLFTVVTYDISDDKRRKRLHKALKMYGTAIQFSAFECLLSSKEFAQMLKAIKELIQKEKDKLRVYTLCNSCYAGVRNLGSGQIEKEREVIVI